MTEMSPQANVEQIFARPRHWAAAILAVFVAQGALILWFSDYRIVVPRTTPSAMRIQVLTSSSSSEVHSLLADVLDPTLLALASPQGFSGAAWLHPARLSYTPASVSEPTRWLAGSAQRLGADFDRFLQTNLVEEQTFAGPIPPTFSQPALDTPIISPAVLIRVEGELSGRELREGQPRPVPTEAILTNTVIRVVVDGDGRTVSTALVSSSGSASADTAAIRFSSRTRFEPVRAPAGQSAGNSNASVVFGNLIFQWYQVMWQDASAARTGPNRAPP